MSKDKTKAEAKGRIQHNFIVALLRHTSNSKTYRGYAIASFIATNDSGVAEPLADMPLYIPNTYISKSPLARTSHQLAVEAFSVRKKQYLYTHEINHRNP